MRCSNRADLLSCLWSAVGLVCTISRLSGILSLLCLSVMQLQCNWTVCSSRIEAGARKGEDHFLTYFSKNLKIRSTSLLIYHPRTGIPLSDCFLGVFFREHLHSLILSLLQHLKGQFTQKLKFIYTPSSFQSCPMFRRYFEECCW